MLTIWCVLTSLENKGHWDEINTTSQKKLRGENYKLRRKELAKIKNGYIRQI